MQCIGSVSNNPFLFQCATASVKDSQKCSQCDTTVNDDNVQFQKYIEILDFLFPVLADAKSEPVSPDSSNSCSLSDIPSSVVVTTLSGDCTTIQYNPNQTIQNLKDTITKHLGPPCNKQCLLYQETELKVLYNGANTLSHLNPKPNPNPVQKCISALYNMAF